MEAHHNATSSRWSGAWGRRPASILRHWKDLAVVMESKDLAATTWVLSHVAGVSIGHSVSMIKRFDCTIFCKSNCKWNSINFITTEFHHIVFNLDKNVLTLSYTNTIKIFASYGDIWNWLKHNSSGKLGVTWVKKKTNLRPKVLVTKTLVPMPKSENLGTSWP